MFEKEAEEYIMREDVSTENDRVPFDNGYGFQTVSFEDEVKKAFKDGAEFGYNKANEWHYVKDGDLPNTENLECLCIIRPLQDNNEKLPNKDFRGVLYFRNGMFYLDEDNCNDYLEETNSDFTDLVIAWKEITPPQRR